MVQLFKNSFAFIGVKFQDYSKKLSLCCQFAEFLPFLQYRNTILMTTSCLFSTLSTLSCFDSLIYMCKYQS